MRGHAARRDVAPELDELPNDGGQLLDAGNQPGPPTGNRPGSAVLPPLRLHTAEAQPAEAQPGPLERHRARASGTGPAPTGGASPGGAAGLDECVHACVLLGAGGCVARERGRARWVGVLGRPPHAFRDCNPAGDASHQLRPSLRQRVLVRTAAAMSSCGLCNRC